MPLRLGLQGSFRLGGDTNFQRFGLLRLIAFHLWPDTPESHARNNLRQLLFQLRHALPNADDYLTVDGATITWRAAGAQEVDVRDFAQALLDSQAAEAREILTDHLVDSRDRLLATLRSTGRDEERYRS